MGYSLNPSLLRRLNHSLLCFSISASQSADHKRSIWGRPSIVSAQTASQVSSDGSLELHADPTVARGADIKATITDLNVERMARLHGRIRLSTRELIAAAAPTDDAATEPIQSNRGSWTRNWVTFSCLRHLIQPQTPFFDH